MGHVIITQFLMLLKPRYHQRKSEFNLIHGNSTLSQNILFKVAFHFCVSSRGCGLEEIMDHPRANA